MVKEKVIGNHGSDIQLIDSHCHFDFSDFDIDRKRQWQQCLGTGVGGLIIPGVNQGQWSKAKQLCSENTDWFYGVGVHPWWSSELNAPESNHPEPHNSKRAVKKSELGASIENYLSDSQCVAIGECGLDKVKSVGWRYQVRIFEWHLQWAQEFKKPIIIHCVKAHDEIFRLLKRYNLTKGGVIHGFSGSFELAKQYWELGFYLGIGGTITYERAKKTRDAVRRLPLDAILLETDSPDMPLCGHQGRRNTPTVLITIAEVLGEIRQVSLLTIAKKTMANTKKLFNL